MSQSKLELSPKVFQVEARTTEPDEEKQLIAAVKLLELMNIRTIDVSQKGDSRTGKERERYAVDILQDPGKHKAFVATYDIDFPATAVLSLYGVRNSRIPLGFAVTEFGSLREDRPKSTVAYAAVSRPDAVDGTDSRRTKIPSAARTHSSNLREAQDSDAFTVMGIVLCSHGMSPDKDKSFDLIVSEGTVKISLNEALWESCVDIGEYKAVGLEFQPVVAKERPDGSTELSENSHGNI